MKRLLVLLLFATGAFAQQIVWSEDFERYAAQSAPTSWLDPSGRFRTFAEEKNIVYGAQHPVPKQRSVGRRGPADVPEHGSFTTLGGRTFTGRDGFELRGRFRRATAESLLGITFFSRQPELDAHHLIALWRRGGDAAPVLRLYQRTDALRELSASDFTPAIGVWYRFVIRTDKQFDGTVIRARFWRDGDAEPGTWHLTAINSGSAAPSGRIGLWSAYGAAHFDDLSVSAEVEEEVDRVGPAILFSEGDESIAPDTTAAFNRDARVEVRALDASGVKSLTVTLDDAPYAPPIVAERRHVLRARAVDNAGNVSEASIAVVVDKTPPVVEVTNIVPLTNGSVTPVISVTDMSPVQTEARLDGATFTSGTVVEDERAHRLTVTATDSVGWTTTVTRDFVIDRTPPATAFSGLANGAVRNADTKVEAVATDANGIASLTTSHPDVITSEGAHTVTANAVDKAGNAAQAALTFTIDKTPPNVTVTNVVPLTKESVTPLITFTDLTPVQLDAKLNGVAFTSGTVVAEERRHTLTVTATDAAGWTTTLDPIVFTIDRTPPAVTITAPAAEERIGAGTVDVSGTSDDAVRVLVNGVAATVANGTFRRAGVPLSEGANAIVAVGSDGAGNDGRAELRVHRDTRAPELLLLAPAPNACVGGNDVVVRGTIREAATVRVRANDGAFVNATISGTDWSATVPLPSEGRVTLSVEAADGGGHSVTATLPVVVDRTRPRLELNESGTLFNRPVAPLVRADDATATVVVTLNGAAFTAGTVLRDDGTYVLRATATDCAGNAADPLERTFTIDRTPPRIETITPASGATAGNKPAISGTLSEPATLADETTGTTATVDGVRFSLAAPLVDGVNEHVLVATDGAGNVSRTAYSVRVKSGAPFVEIVENGAPIVADALFNRVVTPLIRVSDPKATVTATLNGAAFTSGTAIASDARYTLTATATDSFGHVSDTATATFTVDRTPPRIDITSPADGASIGSDRVEVRGTVDADATGVSVNGVAATVSGTSFTASVILEAGANLLTGTATDRAGNTGRDRVEVTRDAGPLAILLTSPPDDLLTNRPTTIVAGQVLTQPPGGTVQLNGVSIPVTAGGTFRVVDFPLVEGENDIVASVANARGETSSVAVDVNADFTPPVLRVTANALDLADGARFATSPVLAVESTDGVELTIDGALVTGAIPSLANGGHALTAVARDAAGNETRVDRTFFIGDHVTTGGCGLTAIDPASGAAVFAGVLQISGRSGGAAGVLIDGRAAFVADGSFCGEATLQPGRNEIVIRCADAAGNPTTDAPVTLVVHRDAEPSITITSPASGATLTNGTVTVSGTVSAGIVSGDVNGLPITVSGTTFSAPNVTLSAGLNSIVARAKSGAGRIAIDTAHVTLRNAAPQLAITSPIAGTETGASTVDVTGTYVHVDPTTIRINGAAATATPLTDTSGTFRGSAPAGTITAVARNHAGAEARATVDVQQVTGAPSISITAPVDNSVVAANEVQVTGTFNPAAGAQVTVNGATATVSGGTFTATVALSSVTPIIARITTPGGDDAMDAVRVVRSTPLTLRESFPAAGASGVDRGAAIILLFNNTVEDATPLRLTDSSNTNVAGQLFVDRDAVTFAPHEPLRANETYTVTFGAIARSFTTAATAPAAAPLLDDVETTGCFSSVTLTGRATPNARVRVDADGVTRNVTASATGAFSVIVTFDGQSGFHMVRVREAGSDGSLSAERSLCFRLSCELPRVAGATLDRNAKKLVVDFTRAIDPATLILGRTLVVEPALAGSVSVTGPTATITFNEDVPPVKITLTVKDVTPLYTQSFPFDSGPQERGKGYVTGAVYDATTGRPLADATVTIDTVATTTNDRGRYSRALAEGAYTIAVTAEGYTGAWRQVVVPAGAGVVPIDIRLTRRNATLSSGGDTSVTKRVELANGERVTAVGAQSLPGLLPLGWSPLAAAEVLGAQPGARLTFHTGSTTRTLTVARYDEQRDEWRVLAAAAMPTDGKLAVDLTESGHYAVVYPDAAAHLRHPPVARTGAALQGVVNPCLEQPALCALTSRAFTLEPRAILPNGRAVATLVTEGTSQIYPSGTAVQATIDEQLNLADGRVLVDPPFATDLLLYRTLAGDSAVAEFHLAPTPQAAAVTLRDGVEHVRFVEYPGRIDRGTLLGAEGGRVPGDGRVTVDVPSGATPEPLHASTASLPDAELAALGPIAGFRIAGGFTLTLTRATAAPPVDGVVDVAPSLLIPARATFDVPNATNRQVIVAEVLPRSEYGVLFQLVAIAEAAGGTLFNTRAIDSTQLPLDGIVRDGRYVILVADAPIAYAYGIVRGGVAGLQPAVPNARVTTNHLGVTSLTTRAGLFVLPVQSKPAAPFTLVARTPQTGDGATATASAAPDAGAFVNFGNLLLEAQPPELRGVTPDGGELAPAAAFVVRAEFDRPIDPASVAGGIRVSNLAGSVSAAGNSVTFNASEPLKAASQYDITIAPTIRGTNGAPFGRTVVRTFRTSAIPTNGTVRPELIRITMPDANGRSRIYGTAGALPSGAQAVAVRRDRDFVVRYQATVANDGAFSFDAGGGEDRIALDDFIDLQVLDAVSRGIIAVVPLTPFSSDDLRTFIAPPTRDSVFLTADGIRVSVPAGAFDVPTAITVTRAAQSSFSGVPKFDEELGFGAAIELRFDGVAKKRIDLDLPVPDGVTTTNRNWYVGHLGDSIRGPRVMIVDLAYVSGNRFRTGVTSTTPGARRLATNAGVTGPELREHLLGVNRSGIYALVDFRFSGGALAFGILEVFQQGYDLFWDTLESLYAAHWYLTEGRGRVAIPLVAGKQFRIAGVDAATGLEGFAKIYDPIAIGDPGTGVALPSPSVDREGPYPILGSPFRVETVDVNAKNVTIESVRDFKVELKNGVITATTTLAADVDVAMLNVTRGTLDPSRAGGLTLDGEVGDRVLLLIGEKNVDPHATLSLTFSEPVTSAELFRITLDGVEIEVKPRLDAGGRRVVFDMPASLQRGKTYRLEISPDVADASGLRIGQTRDADGVASAPLSEPLYLEFDVREPAGRVASFDLDEGLVRDQALIGNVLLVSALDGGIFAYDVSNPVNAQPVGHHPGDATSYWALATDHHGRVFATGMTPMMGIVRSFRIEDFLKGDGVRHKGAGSVSFNPGTAAALNIASRVIASDRPEAIPRKIQIAVQDREVPYDDRAELKTIGGAVVTSTVGDLEVLRLESPFDGAKPYALQRVTVENLTLDMRWSADAMHGQPAKIEGIVGRATDRFRVLYNEVTYGVVSLLGYGIAVVDLNAIDSNDAPVKKPGYTNIAELVRLTSGKVYEQCTSVAGYSIPNLEFTPDAAIRPGPGPNEIDVFALDPHRGILDLRVRPPRNDVEAALPADRVRCDERLSGTGLVFRNAFPSHDHPRLAKLRESYEARTGRAPFGRFNAAAPYTWILEAADNAVVKPASGPGTVALGQRGSPAGERVQRDYLLIPANEYGLLVVEAGGHAPAADVAGAPPLHDSHLVDVIWIPHGAFAVRTIPRTHLATVTDGEGHVLLVDLARLDERWDIESDELFPTVRGILESDVATPDPRIVWRSKEPLAGGTLAPVVDADTGFVYAGKLLEKTTNVVSALDPRIQIKADIGNGLAEIGGVVPLGIQPPASVPLHGPNASLGAFRFEVSLPGALDESTGGSFDLAVENERVFGAKSEETPQGWPRAHLKLPMRRTVPASMTSLRHQRGYNKWISPWVVAIADPRASETYTWPANADRAREGCYACTRPERLQGKKESDGVYELFTNGRLLKARPDILASSPYGYLAQRERLTARFATVMADTVRAPGVLVAAQAPPIAGGMLQETTYLHSGELETSHVDLDAGGRAGWNVVFDRTFRSRTIGGTPLGLGWDSTIYRRLRVLPTNDVEYRDGGGEVWRFRWNGSGGYTAPAGLYLGLSRNDRGFTMVSQGGRITQFDPLGRIAFETDEFAPNPHATDKGNVIRYLYGADGLLQKIIDPVGRESLVTHDVRGRLQSVKETTRNRTVTYTAEGALLKSVTLPQVANSDAVTPKIAYGYQSIGSAFEFGVNSISDLKEVPRVTFGYTAGRVTTQSWATSETATFTYTPNAATVRDALQQERRYTLTAAPSDYHSDRAHVQQLDEVAVETSTFAFGQLPASVTTTPPRAPVTRTYTFSYEDGALKTATLAGVRRTTNTYAAANSAPGRVLQSSVTEPLAAAGSAITRTFGYKRNRVSSVTAADDDESSSLQFAVPRIGALADSASNDSITETQTVDEYGRLTGTRTSGGTDTESAGAAATFRWDNGTLPLHARGELREVDRSNLRTTIAYPSHDKVEITDVERNVKTTTELDAWLRPKSVVTTGPALSLEGETDYDANGRVKKIRRKQGGTWITEEFFYDQVGRLRRSTIDNVAIDGAASVAETRIDYDLGGRRITRTLPGGAEVIDALDGLGRVMTRTTVTGSSNIVEQFAYDLTGNVVYSADTHLASAAAFDVHGRELAALHPDGTRTEVDHDAMNNPKAVRELGANGALIAETHPTFTAAGRLQSVATRVDAAQTRTSAMKWDGAGRMTVAETGDRFSRQRFDEAGRLRSAETPFSRLTASSHTGVLVAQATVEEKGSAPVAIANQYDTLANVTEARVGPLRWQQTFDQSGNLTSAVRPGRGEEARHHYDHDSRGSVTAERKPGATFTHKYDAAGAATEYRDPLDPPTTTVNDRIGRPQSRTYADGTSELWTWEGARLLSYTDREQRRFVYGYNARGQVETIRDASDALLERLEYHPSGDLWKWRTRDAELTFEDYDLEGRPRLTKQKRYTAHSGFTSATVRDEFTQTHEWNVHGERKAWTLPGTSTRIEETYDAEGNVETIRRGGTLLMSADHRAAGRLSSRTVHTGAASIVRTYGYDAASGQLNDLTVRVGEVVVAGSHIEYEGVQVRSARLHGVSGGARANEYTYDPRGRLETSKSAREAGAPESREAVDAADFRHALVRPGDDPRLPSLTFDEEPGHKIARVTRGDSVRTFSYGGGAERVSDGRFSYEFDARGRLISATEELPAGRRFLYDYSATGRVVGRRAEYQASGEWKLEDRPAVLAADALPADTTFVWDPISDRLAAIYGFDGSLIRAYVHGGAAYDDPIEVTTPGGRLYPVFDEAGAGNLQAILDANGKVVSRSVVEGAYGEDEFTLTGAAVDRIAIEAKKDAAGALETITITVRATEALDPATVPTGARLAVVDDAGTVVRSAPTTPTLFDNDQTTLRWTLTGPQWTDLTAGGGAQSLSIAVTNTLRATAWSSTTPILPPPPGSTLHTSATHPVELREPLTPLASWITTVPPATTRTTAIFTAPALATLADAAPARDLGTAAFQALPFAEPATGLVYARARWYDSNTGSFLSPDPMGYVDSSNLYAFAGGDPVNRRDPTGESYWIDRSKEIISILRQKQLPEWDRERIQLLAELRDVLEHKYETDPHAPKKPGVVKRAWNALFGSDWGGEAEAAYTAKLEQGYRSTYRAPEIPEVAEIYGTADRGKVLQDATFRDIGGKGVNAGGTVVQGAVQGSVVKVAGAGAGYLAGQSARVARIRGLLRLYPDVIDPRTGRSIPFPSGVLDTVAKETRVVWQPAQKAEFIAEWHRRGYAAPPGGWSEYDIHHILPREYGGRNDFWNLVPVLRKTHVNEFNKFWREFGGL